MPKSSPQNLPHYLSLALFINVASSFPSLASPVMPYQSPTMARPTAFSPVFFLFLVSLYLIIIANGVHSVGEKKTLKLQKLQQAKPQLGPLGCLLPESRRENGAIVMEMKERGHCSTKKHDWIRRIQKQLVFDKLRVRWIQNRIRKLVSGHIEEDVSETQVPLTSGIVLQTLNYIVTVGLNSQNMTVIVDTGSDLTWVQCEPCKSCYDQQGALFKPSTSPSYQSVRCNSTTCQSLLSATGNSATCESITPTCNYMINYGDGSYSNGELGTEHLSFGGISIDNFVFGCGRNNKGLFGGTSGLMGLGRSKLSVISQTDSIFGGVFSYCLPTTGEGASGSLVMGNETSVFKNVTPISYTSMIPNPQISTFYVLNLTGINVGSVALQASLNFGNQGVIIDSGTVITRLAPSVYKALKAEFSKQFSGFPSAPGFSILDTCYNLSGNEEVNIPTIRMYFEDNAELNVDATGILYMAKEDASQVCLALASLSDEYEMGIIGNYQQRNQRIVYDIKQSKVGFAGEPCGFS